MDGVGQYIAGKIDQILAQDPNLNNNLQNNTNFNNNNSANNNNFNTNNNTLDNANFSISEWLEKLGYPQYP